MKKKKLVQWLIIITAVVVMVRRGDLGKDRPEKISTTDEIEIGTWIDGKTIYRKVIEGTTADSEGANKFFADVADLRIEEMIRLYGKFVTNSGTGATYPIPTAITFTNDSIYGNIYAFYETSTKTIKYGLVGQSYVNVPAFLVIEYTKR